MEEIKRCIDGIGFPFVDELDLTRRDHIIIIVRWLEDTFIRELQVEERENLKGGNLIWDDYFSGYLRKLGCPFTWHPSSALDCIHFLAATALSHYYSDQYIEQQHEEQLQTAIIDFGRVLGIGGCSTNNIETAEHNIDEILREIYSKLRLAIDKEKWNEAGVGEGQSSIPSLEDFPLGFDTQEPMINKIALVLRMLYLSDLHDLSIDINSLLVLVQEYTANPRLNAAYSGKNRVS